MQGQKETTDHVASVSNEEDGLAEYLQRKFTGYIYVRMYVRYACGKNIPVE